MDSPIFENLRSLINLVDELRDIGLQQYIKLPRVCVVGTQSSGKSSVLESIVGIDFLPRGDGVVTRRPLELRLVHTAGLEKPWAIFESNKAKKYTNFTDVRLEIERLTDEIAGKNKGIVDDPIVLAIYGSQCPDLTLIDLPGITRVPLKGSDQTDDIEKVTREMAARYAEDPRTIILAVIAANADMSTSDALQLSRRVDPNGLRTIGVITKIDLMDRGTDAVKMLLGEEIPLRLGFTGVINRSQEDILNGKTIQQQKEDEKKYFQNNPLYRNLTQEQSALGVMAFVSKLTKTLFRHIKHLLPDIKKEIDGKRRSVTSRLRELGEGVPEDAAGRTHILWTMINDYCEIVRSIIRGRYVRKLQTLFEQSELSGASKIRVIFNELMSDMLEKSCTADMTDVDIDMAIQIHEGDSLPGFPSPDTFEYLIRPHMKKIQGPSLDCLDRVTHTLEILCQSVAARLFSRFPLLIDKVLEITEAILSREREQTKRVIEDVVSAETGYLFTNDTNYLEMHGSMIKTGNETEPEDTNTNSSTQPVEQTKAKERNKLFDSMTKKTSQVISSATSFYYKEPRTRYSAHFIQEIRKRLDSYFSLVIHHIRDTIPKCIGHFLIRQLLDCLQYELYTELNAEFQTMELLGEPQSIVEERKFLAAQLATLSSANQILLRDSTLSSVAIDIQEADFEDNLRNSSPLTSALPSGTRKEEQGDVQSNGSTGATMERAAASGSSGLFTHVKPSVSTLFSGMTATNKVNDSSDLARRSVLSNSDPLRS